ncbi:polysaccharide deacetylase family protein [Chengkuizengella marina]|uniref:Polysaccharide deacetylase family protein n=1 Tax=Chengkuizengella marina TaxID=2507566 RepID=A0A6N9Q815_9BACL|nr:polysaccharide deacetylase family protein [Chengkuizengella marina]NBI30992.1 polysaccharide deacetylase family protein [Chengkuizengella marina]
MKKILFVIIFALILILTACIQESVEVEISPSNTTTNKPTENQENNQDITNDVTEETEEVITETPIEKDPVEEINIEEPISQDYYMSEKSYDIKTKDESINKDIVLLTFDDGPKEEEMLTKMLDILDKHNAKAIFFVNGYRIEQNPDLLKLIYDRGQIIGNHSWDHINLKNESNEKINQQVEDVQNIVEELTGEKPIYFRPPHGAGNEYLRKKVKEEGMLYMTWSNGSEDWVKKYQYSEGVIQNVMGRLRAGSNILMHELPWTVEALDTLLSSIEEEGYRFVDPRAIDIEYEIPQN